MIISLYLYYTHWVGGQHILITGIALQLIIYHLSIIFIIFKNKLSMIFNQLLLFGIQPHTPDVSACPPDCSRASSLPGTAAVN